MSIPISQFSPPPPAFLPGNHKFVKKRHLKETRGFPGGAVVKNPPANAEYTGSSPGPGRSHMPRSN